LPSATGILPSALRWQSNLLFGNLLFGLSPKSLFKTKKTPQGRIFVLMVVD